MASPAASTTGIGARIPRRELKRLLTGHGRYIDDIKLPRMLHACFVRSPHPHAKVVSIDIRGRAERRASPAVLTAVDINPRCEPFVGVALHRAGPSVRAAATVRRRARGLAGPAGRRSSLADSRAQAEDAAELVEIEWEPLPVVGDQFQAIAPGAPVIHARNARQRRLRFHPREGRAGQGLRRGRCRDRGGTALRAPDGDDPRAARADRRFQPERRLADRHPLAPVAVPDAADLQQAPRAFPSTRSASSRPTSAAASA